MLTYVMFSTVNVLEKLVKPPVRKAPEGAFRYFGDTMNKPFKTYDELLDFLEDEKELNIKDRAAAKAVLSKASYYSLINGYKDIFKNKTTGYYKKESCFDDIYNLYKFDRDLRSVFLKYILIAEKSVKTSLAYYFSELYGESICWIGMITEISSMNYLHVSININLVKRLSNRWAFPKIGRTL